MKFSEYPKLLVAKRLSSYLSRSTKELVELRGFLGALEHDIPIRGIFVLALSTTEVMLSDSLQYYLKCFPGKLGESDFRFSKDQFMSNYFELLDLAIDRKIQSLSYSSFPDYMRKYIDLVSVEWDSFPDDCGDDIQEIKARRNLLLHNNLQINDSYRRSAGPKGEDTYHRLKISKQYCDDSIGTMILFSETLKSKIEETYFEYTKVNANKSLWNFLFNSPVMPYDDFWNYSKNQGHIMSIKKGPYEDALSGTETRLLSVWRALFTGSNKHLQRADLKMLTLTSREKLLFLLSIAHDFEFE